VYIEVKSKFTNQWIEKIYKQEMKIVRQANSHCTNIRRMKVTITRLQHITSQTFHHPIMFNLRKQASTKQWQQTQTGDTLFQQIQKNVSVSIGRSVQCELALIHTQEQRKAFNEYTH